jgi:hypothetical protein
MHLSKDDYALNDLSIVAVPDNLLLLSLSGIIPG